MTPRAKELLVECKDKWVELYKEHPIVAITAAGFCLLMFITIFTGPGIIISIVLGIAIGLGRTFGLFYIFRSYALYILNALSGDDSE